MSILSSTRLSKTVTGHRQLVDIVIEQSELDGNFEINREEDDHRERLMQCLAIAMPYFSVCIASILIIYIIYKHLKKKDLSYYIELIFIYNKNSS